MNSETNQETIDERLIKEAHEMKAALHQTMIYCVISRDGRWCSGFRPDVESAMDNFLSSRRRRGEDDDWDALQKRGYRLIQMVAYTNQIYHEGQWIEIRFGTEGDQLE